MTFSDLIAIATFRSRAAAQTAQIALNVAGVDSLIREDPAIIDRDSRDGRYPSSDGAQLLVRPEDAERASQALRKRS